MKQSPHLTFGRIALSTTTALLLTVSAAQAKTGDALSLVPADATTIGMVRLADMRSSPLCGQLFSRTDKLTSDGDAARFMEEAGIKPSEDVDVVVLAVSPPLAGSRERTLIAIEGRFDIDRLTNAIVARGGKRLTSEGGAYIRLHESSASGDDMGAVAFLNRRLAVVGSESSVTAALASRGSGAGQPAMIARHMKLIDPAATAWMLVDIPAASRNREFHSSHGKNDQKHDQMKAALKGVSVVGFWAADVRDALRFGGTAVTSDEETGELLEDTVRGLLAAWRLGLQEKAPELVSVIRKFEIDRNSRGLSITGSIPAEMITKFQQKHAALHEQSRK